MTPKGGGGNATVFNHASKVSMNLAAALVTAALAACIDDRYGRE